MAVKKEATAVRQREFENRRLPFKSRDLQTFSIRLTRVDIEALRRYFDEKGIRLSQGIRMWLLERMKQEGIQ